MNDGQEVRSFYGSVPEQPREDLLSAYLAFLKRRNGTTDPTVPFPVREGWLKDADGWAARHREPLDTATFERNYTHYDARTPPGAAMVALLAFAKVNAGEAYGVEVLTRKRHGGPPPTDLFARVERVLASEETYHTKILVGAARQFGVPPPSSAWRPPLPLKVVIGTLAHAPKALFHPVLLGAEIGGVFTFNWMLTRVGELFRDEPALKETLEARLMEILVDELGHIAFNRMAVGPTGLRVARELAARVATATSGGTPEFRALGWTAETSRAIGSFDLRSVPEEVRARAFFV